MAAFTLATGKSGAGLRTLAGLAALIAATVVVYRPGLSGPFLFDDFVNFLDNELTKLVSFGIDGLYGAAFSATESYPRRGLAFLSFALNHLLDGGRFDAYSMKSTNLAIHVLNACLVYCLARALYPQLWARSLANATTVTAERAAMTSPVRLCALFAAAIWALHPMQLTPVLYVVQRMTSLAGTFVLLGVLSYVLSRRLLPRRPIAGAGAMVASTGICTAGGVLCKENAALLPFLIVSVEWFFFDRSSLPARARRMLVFYVLLVAVVPALLACAFLFSNWDVWLLGGYGTREFTLEQRLLTQCRVLLEYLRWLLAPDGRSFGIFHDDISLSTGLYSPPGTAVAVVSWCVAVAAAAVGAFRRRLWSFGIVWFLVAHAIESSVIPLELAYEHRNYVPSIGLFVCVSWYAMLGLRRFVSSGSLRVLVSVLPLALVAFLTFSRATAWAHEATIMESGVRNHPKSSRYHAEWGTRLFWFKGDLVGALGHLQKASELDPGNVATLLFVYKMVAYRELVEEGELDDYLDSGETLPGELKSKIREDWPMADVERSKLSLEREIASRLATRRIQAASVVVLAQAAQCARQGTSSCVRIEPKIREWTQIALGNALNSSDVRGHLSMLYARLLIASGNSGQALDYLREAVREHPERPAYRLILVEQLVGAGHRAEASTHRRALGLSRDRHVPLRERIDELLDRLDDVPVEDAGDGRVAPSAATQGSRMTSN